MIAGLERELRQANALLKLGVDKTVELVERAERAEYDLDVARGQLGIVTIQRDQYDVQLREARRRAEQVEGGA